MKIKPGDLRIQAPRTAAPDHVIEQLSALARTSVATPVRRRGLVVIAVTTGALAVGVGGAWASGTIEVPGLPKPGRNAPADPTPERPEAPTPSDRGAEITPSPQGPGGPTASPPDAERPGPRYGVDEDRKDNSTPSGQQEQQPSTAPGEAADATPSETPERDARGRNARGQEEAESHRPEGAGKPEDPGKSEQAKRRSRKASDPPGTSGSESRRSDSRRDG